MNRVRVGAACVAAVSVAGLLAGCGKDSAQDDSPVAFQPVTGDQYTSNPGAFQTDGVVAPPKDVVMVGDPVAAQAAVNAGLPQGTITSTSGDTTVYFPPAPPVPGLVVPPQPAPPAPMSRAANTRPWQYTQPQIDVYRTICETGRWGSWVAGVEVQTQTCWTLYGRQLGVRPWTPDQPKPWLRPGYPRPWFDPGFRADVPVMWIYPRGWTRPRPQPVISVSITINIGNNPYRRVNPRHPEPFYPVWAVVPGRVVDVRDQARIVAPVYTSTTTTTTTTTTVTAPVAPGVVLAPLPTSAKVAPVLALPGQAVPGNVNTDAAVTAPVPAALQGATVQAGSRASLEAAIGTSVSVAVPTTTAAAAAASTGAVAPATGTPTAAAPPSGTVAPAEGRTSAPGAPPAVASSTVPSAPRTGGAPETTVAQAPTTTVPPVVTQPPTTQPPTTQPPAVTQAPTTQAPVTQPPVTQPPTTKAPVTQATTTQAPVVVPPTTTIAPVPTTTVAPKPVAPTAKPAKPAPATTTTPPPAEN